VNLIIDWVSGTPRAPPRCCCCGLGVPTVGPDLDTTEPKAYGNQHGASGSEMRTQRSGTVVTGVVEAGGKRWVKMMSMSSHPCGSGLQTRE